MEEICKNCYNYRNNDTYPETGYCSLYEDFTKDNDSCIDYDEGEEE